MNTDFWRLLFTYGIAVLVLGGVFVLLFQKLPELTAEALLSLATFALGLVLGFVFNKESSTGGARAQERAFREGAQTASGHVDERRSTPSG